MRQFAQSTLAKASPNRHYSLEAAFPWLLALLAVGYVAFHWSDPVTLAPDSGGYLNFSEHRTAGYPLFLRAVEALFGTTDAAQKVQLVIAASAFVFLGWSVHRASRSPFFALAPVVALMLYPRVANLHGYILTESIFVSLLCLMIGAIALSAHRPTWQWFAFAALACGLAIAVRPAGLSLLAIWPLLFWLTWRRCEGRRLALAAAAVAPIALCIVAENVIWHAYHDNDSRPSLADRHLFSKALIIEPEPSLSDPELAGIVAMGREVMAPARALIAGAPSLYARATLLAEFEVTGQHETYGKVFSPAVRAVAGQRGLEEHRLLAQMGRPAMLSSPVAWIGNGLTHYTGLWSRAFVTPATLDEFQSYIDGTQRKELFDRISPFREGVLHGFRAGLRCPVCPGHSLGGSADCRCGCGMATYSPAAHRQQIGCCGSWRVGRPLASRLRRDVRRDGRPLRRLDGAHDGSIGHASRPVGVGPSHHQEVEARPSRVLAGLRRPPMNIDAVTLSSGAASRSPTDSTHNWHRLDFDTPIEPHVHPCYYPV